jgi:hypothetical protein
MSSLTDNGRRKVQPILFHEMSLSRTQLVIQQIIAPFMSPEPVPAKGAPAPLDKMLPNPAKAGVRDE